MIDSSSLLPVLPGVSPHARLAAPGPPTRASGEEWHAPRIWPDSSAASAALLDMTLRGQTSMEGGRGELRAAAPHVSGLNGRSKVKPAPAEPRSSLSGNYHNTWHQSKSYKPDDSYFNPLGLPGVFKQENTLVSLMGVAKEKREEEKRAEEEETDEKNVIRMPAIKRSATMTPAASATSQVDSSRGWVSRAGTSLAKGKHHPEEDDPAYVRQATVTARLLQHGRPRGLPGTRAEGRTPPRGHLPNSPISVDQILRKQKQIESEYKALKNISTGSIVSSIFDRLNETKAFQRSKTDLQYLSIVGIKPLHTNRKRFAQENDVLCININNYGRGKQGSNRWTKGVNINTSYKRNVNDVRYTGLDSATFDYSTMDLDTFTDLMSDERCMEKGYSGEEDEPNQFKRAGTFANIDMREKMFSPDPYERSVSDITKSLSF